VEPQIGFCSNPDGARIAYATLGQGSAMVFPQANYVTITPYKTIPEVRHYYCSFARHHTVVIYDQLGAGLSERNRTVFTLESELANLETVIDHLKLNSMILYGSGMAGPTAIAYAAKYPERVTHLILYGTYANYGKFVKEEIKASVASFMRQPSNWLGPTTIISLMAPQVDTNMTESLSRNIRDSCTSEIAANFVDMFYKLDVTHLCSHVKTPTLVMHRMGDKYIALKAGLELASLIPNARFIQLEGNIHFPFLGDTESFLSNIFEFLGDTINDVKSEQMVQQVTGTTIHDVFISFAFPDKDAAARIYACLKSNGISPFWCEDLTAGQDYPQLLGEAVRNSKSFLLVVSNSSDNSATVRKETTIAHNNKKPIIPVRIEDILPKNLEYLIANSLFFDAFPQPLEQHLPRLTSDIKKVIGTKADKKEKTEK
jgi:pimeloyl-ACP methyl ester carboxylesterase